MAKWFIYCLLLVFAVYWASNLFLWYPWSYKPTLGMILMLTISPLAWAYTVYLSLIYYPEERVYRGALFTVIIYLVTATLFDFIFFGLIRNALEELYHPTTLYGYGFLIALPFLMAWIFRNRISARKRELTTKIALTAFTIGTLCLSLLIIIILFDLNI